MVSKNGGPGTCAGGGGWEQEDLQCQGWSWGWFRLEFSSPTAWDTFIFANDSCISISGPDFLLCAKLPYCGETCFYIVEK